MPKASESTIQAQEIIAYLNDKAGRRFKLTDKHKGFIVARFNEGYEVDDFKIVIDNMVREWADDPKMYRFLRPETLFGNKFDGYLNLPPPPKPKEEKTSFQKKRDVTDEWLLESEANDKKRVSDGDQGANELRGSEAGQGNARGLVPHVRDGPPW